MNNANKPAHPFVNNEDSEAPEAHYGLTKREYFAAMALGGLCANPNVTVQKSEWEIAAYAKTLSEELLKRLEK